MLNSHLSTNKSSIPSHHTAHSLTFTNPPSPANFVELSSTHQVDAESPSMHHCRVIQVTLSLFCLHEKQVTYWSCLVLAVARTTSAALAAANVPEHTQKS